MAVASHPVFLLASNTLLPADMERHLRKSLKTAALDEQYGDIEGVNSTWSMRMKGKMLEDGANWSLLMLFFVFAGDLFSACLA